MVNNKKSTMGTLGRLGVAVVALLALFPSFGALAATGDITLTGVPATVAPSGTFTAELRLNTGTQLMAFYDLQVQFNSAVLKLTAIRGGDATGFTSNPKVDGLTPLPFGNSGVVNFGKLDTELNGPAGNLLVARLDFEAVGTASQQSTIMLTKRSMEDINSQNIPMNAFSAITVSISGGSPTLAVTPASQSVPKTAGSTSFSIATTVAWTASSNQTCATVSNGSGTGNATLNVNCTANTGAQRTATITVTGAGTTPGSVQVTVVQAAGTTPTLAVTPASRSVSKTAGSTSFSIATTVAWTASSNQTWATVTNGSGTGNATLNVNCTANTGAQRTATITVTGAGTTPGSVQVTVVQAADELINDFCQNALEIEPEILHNGNNTGAETDVTIQGLNDGADVWHKFTPDLAGQYTISLCGSQFDTTLGVFSGSCGTLTELSHDDNYCVRASSLSLYLEQGSTYLIRVAGYGSATGDYSLLITYDVVLVPDLIGLSETEARDYLEESGLFVGSVTTQCVGTIAAGNVISQNPLSGSVVALGSSVDLLVSSGPCPIMYPLMIMTPLNGQIVVTPSQGPDGYLAGTQVTVQAVPNDGYVFRSWTQGLFGYPGNPASFVMNGGITIGAVFAQQTEGEPEPEITAAARALHDYFQTADRNNDGRLSYMEASQQVPGFSIAQFNFLDVDRVGYLTESGLADLLGLSTGEEPLCGCLGCEKSDMSLNGMKKHLGDLFLAGLAMSCLLMFSRRKG